ncbi:MAG: GAF domain-containing protein [Nitrososphaerales archaeon]
MTTRNDAELNTLVRTTRDLVRDALRPDLDLDAFLAEVLRRTRDITPFDVGWLLLREGDRVRIRAADEGHFGDVGMSFPVADCVSGQSILRRAPIFIPDLAEMPAELRRVYKPSRSTARAMRSELVVPLLINDGTEERALGALNIESPEANAFAAGQIEVLRLLADHAALAIELARSRQEAAALSAISLQLARETELGDIVRTVLERALGLIGGRFGQILLTEGSDLVVHYTTNTPPRELGLRFGLHDSVSGLAVQERRPVIVPDVSQPAYFVVERAGQGRPPRLTPRLSARPQYQRVLEREKERIRAEYAAPLWDAGRTGILGILNVETPREEGFSEDQRDRLAALGEQRGAGFRDALLRGDAASLHTLLDEALLLGATTFGQLLELDGDELVIVATTGGEPAGTRVPVAESVSGEVLARRDAYYVPDVDAEPRYHRYLGEEMKSELAVPLLSSESVLGVLNLESPAPGFFTAEHARILQALAGQAALAVERARRFEVERLAAIGGLAGDIVHRLNNPLGALSGWIDMLKRKDFYPELIAHYPYVEQFVARSERDISRAKSIVQELRTELKRRAPTPVILQAAITEALTRAGLDRQGEGARGSVRVEVTLPPMPVRVLAGPSLSGIFWNLFDNAAKAMRDGGTLTVSVTPGPGDDRVTVEVQDTGVGIEPWRLASIFEPGASTTSNSYAPTHGLGLWWTKGQVESYGGSIDVSSQPGEGTSFKIILRTTG